jgi:hypothetical protein
MTGTAFPATSARSSRAWGFRGPIECAMDRWKSSRLPRRPRGVIVVVGACDDRHLLRLPDHFLPRPRRRRMVLLPGVRVGVEGCSR